MESEEEEEEEGRLDPGENGKKRWRRSRGGGREVKLQKGND